MVDWFGNLPRIRIFQAENEVQEVLLLYDLDQHADSDTDHSSSYVFAGGRLRHPEYTCSDCIPVLPGICTAGPDSDQRVYGQYS